MERLSLLYASALFSLATEKGAVDEFLEQAKFLSDVLQGAECRRVLVHPHIPASEKHEFFRKAFEGRIRDDLLGFLFLTADKNREAFLLPALTALIEMIERHNNIITARVLSAVPYGDSEAEALRELLSRKLDKKVKLSVKVDPSLLGGPYIYADGYYIDWTIKKRLRDLTVHMKEGCSA